MDLTEIIGKVAGVVAVLAFVPYIWSVLKGSTQPSRASWLIWSVLGVSILADLFAGIPTLIKAWKFPDTQSTNVYRNGALSAIITLLIIDNWTYAAYGFPVYILVICALLYVFIKFRVGIRLKPVKTVA